MNKNILIIAGEPSGDMRAGELLAEFKKLQMRFSFWGIGGARMEQEGVELVEHIHNLSVIGLWEAVKKLPKIYIQYKKLTREIEKRRPDLAILIDYPGFNLRLAKFLHNKNIPVVYYVIPQIWAWGAGRIKSLKKYVKKAIVLLKFEEDLLIREGIPCEFAGHPLVDNAPPLAERKGNFTIALLPGSRKNEILNILPAMLLTAEKIYQCRKDIRFIIAQNSHVDKTIYDSFIKNHPFLPLTRLVDNTFETLNQSDFVLVTSGTATLETAFMQKPMTIIYRTAFLCPFLIRLLIKTPFFGLPNIIAGEKIVPELLGKNAVPDKLFQTVMEIIDSPIRMQTIKNNLKKLTSSLGEKGASAKAAKIIAEILTRISH